MRLKRLKTKIKVEDALKNMGAAAKKAASKPVRAQDAKELPLTGPKPWPVPHGEGGNMLADETGSYFLVLDRGAMVWLWELAESKALDHYRRYGDMPAPLNVASNAALRAVEALRESVRNVEG